ncbi:hypothetical protein [Luteococcus sp.]|uniref:hypothetical protein n=1 Tax=Luteococcus sp. TaxID=1969402 RepID=UPI0037358DE8
MKINKVFAPLAMFPLAMGALVVASAPSADAATYCTHGTTKVDVALRPDEGYAWANWTSKPASQKFRARLVGKGALPDRYSGWRETSGRVQTSTLPWVGVGGSSCENRAK